MTIRLVFECTRCGSKFFRPSTQRTFRDTILRKFGVTPQRCYRCRGRFYLYRPEILAAFLRTLAAPPETEAAIAARAGREVAYRKRSDELA